MLVNSLRSLVSCSVTVRPSVRRLNWTRFCGKAMFRLPKRCGAAHVACSLRPFVRKIEVRRHSELSPCNGSAVICAFEKFIEGFHVEAGLPWWLSLVGSTVLFRLAATAPLSVIQNVNISRLRLLRPEIRILRQTVLQLAQAPGNPSLFLKSQVEVGGLFWSEKAFYLIYHDCSFKNGFNTSSRLATVILCEPCGCRSFRFRCLLHFRLRSVEFLVCRHCGLRRKILHCHAFVTAASGGFPT